MVSQPAVDLTDLAAELGVQTASQLKQRKEELTLPVSPALAGIFPDGLRRGSTVQVASTSMLLMLLSSATQQGSWAAVCGFPDLGVVAAQELGVDLQRCALVPHISMNLAKIIATLIDAVDIVVLRHAELLSPPDARRLVARARERKCVLVLHQTALQGVTPLSVDVTESQWVRTANGKGRLKGRWVHVRAGGRGVMSRPLQTTVWVGHGEAPPPSADELIDFADRAGRLRNKAENMPLKRENVPS